MTPFFSRLTHQWVFILFVAVPNVIKTMKGKKVQHAGDPVIGLGDGAVTDEHCELICHPNTNYSGVTDRTQQKY